MQAQGGYENTNMTYTGPTRDLTLFEQNIKFYSIENQGTFYTRMPYLGGISLGC